MMKQFVLEQISITQNSFLSCQDKRCLITCMSRFLALILQPQEILFCSKADALHCFALHSSDQSIEHFEGAQSNLNKHLSNDKLWQLINQKNSLSTYLSITHLQFKKSQNESDDWFCFKSQIHEKAQAFIFVKNPNAQQMTLWKKSPLVASLMIKFFHLLHKYQLIKGDKEQALNLQELNLQQQFSSKTLKLHKMAQQLIASSTLDVLYKTAVEALSELFNFDRSCLILSDPIEHKLRATYATDKLGNTFDESSDVLTMEALEPLMQYTLLHTNKLFEIIENTQLYHPNKVAIMGNNAIIILRSDESLIGWISIDNLLTKSPFQNYEKEILRLYSSLLSSAIIQKREENNLNLLHANVVKLSHQKTELDICRAVVEFSREKLKLDRVAIFLSYDDGQTMWGTFGTSLNGEIADETTFHGPLTKNALLELALASDNQLVCEEATDLYHDDKIVGYGWNAAMLLRNQGKVIGFLVLDNLINQRPLTSHNRHLLSLLSSNLAEILSRKRAEESIYKLNNKLEDLVEQRTKQLANVNHKLEQSNKKLAKLSLADALTGIANRRHFDETYYKEWSTACCNKLNLSIVMLDIDYFKAYNDFYGHQQGDKCLKEVASILKKHFRRAGELVSRYGGEEFVILVNHAQVHGINKRIQVAIEDLFANNIEHIKAPLQRITLSAGLATFKIDKNVPQCKLLKWADDALYQAKSEGKNRLVVFSPQTA